MITLFVIAACSLPADPHWAVGGWVTTAFGGAMIRPDHFVIEKTPEGVVVDVGVWYDLDDDTIAWTSLSDPSQEHFLSKDGSYFYTYASGFITPTTTAKRGVVPREFDAYEVGYSPPEVAAK